MLTDDLYEMSPYEPYFLIKDTINQKDVCCIHDLHLKD